MKIEPTDAGIPDELIGAKTLLDKLNDDYHQALLEHDQETQSLQEAERENGRDFGRRFWQDRKERFALAMAPNRTQSDLVFREISKAMLYLRPPLIVVTAPSPLTKGKPEEESI